MLAFVRVVAAPRRRFTFGGRAAKCHPSKDERHSDSGAHLFAIFIIPTMYPATINLFAHPAFIAAQGALGRSWIGTIVIGLVIGFIAKFLTPGREPVGCIITMLIGIAGSVIALLIGQSLHYYVPGQAPGFIASVCGAILLLVIYHLIVRPGRGSGGGPSV
jgi:uncharacterized membrane protein YeaQ/YmgE (transglycosylase-associated protein family)